MGREDIGSSCRERVELGRVFLFHVEGLSGKCIGMEVELSIWGELGVWEFTILMAFDMVSRELALPLREELF